MLSSVSSIQGAWCLHECYCYDYFFFSLRIHVQPVRATNLFSELLLMGLILLVTLIFFFKGYDRKSSAEQRARLSSALFCSSSSCCPHHWLQNSCVLDLHFFDYHQRGGCRWCLIFYFLDTRYTSPCCLFLRPIYLPGPWLSSHAVYATYYYNGRVEQHNIANQNKASVKQTCIK